jgi:hypothetical protein
MVAVAFKPRTIVELMLSSRSDETRGMNPTATFTASLCEGNPVSCKKVRCAPRRFISETPLALQELEHSLARVKRIFGARRLLIPMLMLLFSARLAGADSAQEIPTERLGADFHSFLAKAESAATFTWWLPAHPDALLLPISAGVFVETSNVALMRWLKDGSPWDLVKLPLIGARYEERTLVVIVPWPHYAELVVEDRIGVRFKFPAQRNNTTPCEVVACWRGPELLAAAQAFRSWRESAKETGAIPKPRALRAKAAERPEVARLFGAPHLYLWGPALFSRHDVKPRQWNALARTLRDSKAEEFSGRLVARFDREQRRALLELAASGSPGQHLSLSREVAAGIDSALADRSLLGLSPNMVPAEVVRRNSEALAQATRQCVTDPDTWGDGFSIPMLTALSEAGVDRALLLLSDLYGHAAKPHVAAEAARRGFLMGPYDSYHSVHDPEALPDETWATAQFDRAAYEIGRILNPDGSGRAGFKGRGYHFSPLFAKPYVHQRVARTLGQTSFSAWFVDCDATSESFDDYHPEHPATRLDDVQARRNRLRWLATDQNLVVGSEEGSVLFSDVIDFGHGIHTPYVGHLARELQQPSSPHFLGRHWPADTPASSFKSIPTPPGLITPYFDARVRVPLYQAALGDEIMATHHWTFDSLKLSDLAAQRELMELLYVVPPMYHLNRETWPRRRDRIVRHFKFWSPLHQKLASAPMVRFEWLAKDRLLQRTAFRLPEGEVNVTVNFAKKEIAGFPAASATVGGPLSFPQLVYRTDVNLE